MLYGWSWRSQLSKVSASLKEGCRVGVSILRRHTVRKYGPGSTAVESDDRPRLAAVFLREFKYLVVTVLRVGAGESIVLVGQSGFIVGFEINYRTL